MSGEWLEGEVPSWIEELPPRLRRWAREDVRVKRNEKGRVMQYNLHGLAGFIYIAREKLPREAFDRLVRAWEEELANEELANGEKDKGNA